MATPDSTTIKDDLEGRSATSQSQRGDVREARNPEAREIPRFSHVSAV
jgi:hypothetical protein